MTASNLLPFRLHACVTPNTLPRRPQLARALWPGLALGLAFVLAGCAGVTPPRPGAPAAPPPATAASPAMPPPAEAPPGAPGTPAPNARTAGAETLAIEQRWLQDWFRGTPVRIALRGDGTLAVDVPREFSFDAGRSQIKPALGAVLDKVAESLRRRPTTRLVLLSAPGDPATPGAATLATLALQRATGVQRHLQNRGIALARLGQPAAEGGSSVQLRIGTLAPSP